MRSQDTAPNQCILCPGGGESLLWEFHPAVGRPSTVGYKLTDIRTYRSCSSYRRTSGGRTATLAACIYGNGKSSMVCWKVTNDLGCSSGLLPISPFGSMTILVGASSQTAHGSAVAPKSSFHPYLTSRPRSAVCTSIQTSRLLRRLRLVRPIPAIVTARRPRETRTVPGEMAGKRRRRRRRDDRR